MKLSCTSSWFWALWGGLTSSFAPFRCSSRVTHAHIQCTRCAKPWNNSWGPFLPSPKRRTRVAIWPMLRERDLGSQNDNSDSNIYIIYCIIYSLLARTVFPNPASISSAFILTLKQCAAEKTCWTFKSPSTSTRVREGVRKKRFYLGQTPDCGWLGVKSPELNEKKTMSCLWGIFDHSKHFCHEIFEHFFES